MPVTLKHSLTRRSFLFVFIAFSLFFTSSGCGLDIGVREEKTSAFPSSKEMSEEIEFIAELPVPLVEGDSLALDVVDEIKGIPNNITRYNMTMIDDLHYHVIISARTASNVSYRYAKIGTITQSELTLSGRPVRYRLFHVGKSNQVKDIVPRWTEDDYSGFAGNLSGTVLDKRSGDPISDVLICFAGYQAFTDSSGKFYISNVPEGVHNFVGFPIDGAYEVFQQNIQIDRDRNTTISVELAELKEITVKFIVNSPPVDNNTHIRMAGNFYQFGNTFADLQGGVNILASRMPIMEEVAEGVYYFETILHAGNDLHYIYTQGDGFWNREQGLIDFNGYRQIIIPETDITISDTIQEWQIGDYQPINILLSAPDNTPSKDTVSIQFGTGSWFEPVPMVASDSFQWKFSLFTPFPEDNNLKYRFCRNSVCDLSSDESYQIFIDQVNVADDQVFGIDMLNWSSWAPDNSPSTIIASNIPQKEANYLTGIEFLPEYHPSHLESYLYVFNELNAKGVNTIILHPSRSFEQLPGNSLMYLDPHYDLLAHDIIEIGSMLDSLDMKLILSPIIRNYSDHYNTPPLIGETESDVLIDNFSELNINYAHLASNLDEEKFIIDISSIYPFLQKPNDGEINTTQSWFMLSEIIAEVKNIFAGDVICSLPVSYSIPFPSDLFISCDELYFLFDSTVTSQVSFQDINNGIGSILDDQILPAYKSSPKPIFIGFSASSKSPDISNNSYLYDPANLSPQNSRALSEEVDLNYQALVYNAFLNEIMERDWIKGVVARDFYAPLKLTDASSSINGKPAMDVIWYWYTGIR